MLDSRCNLRRLNGNILHYSYYTVEEHIERANKYSTFAAKALIVKGKPVFFIQVIINPIAKFIRNYILRLGFLDGFYGFLICQITANETFLKYIKAWHMRKLNRKM